ncbi:hypothetical protein ACFLIN_03890 [Corynebacterium kutscheri]|uniref:hypothetical protein n=1 Tax=Corynebacterium kutscheri TaxID=35755 RepID=UPI0037C0ED64
MNNNKETSGFYQIPVDKQIVDAVKKFQKAAKTYFTAGVRTQSIFLSLIKDNFSDGDDFSTVRGKAVKDAKYIAAQTRFEEARKAYEQLSERLSIGSISFDPMEAGVWMQFDDPEEPEEEPYGMYIPRDSLEHVIQVLIAFDKILPD